MRIRFMQIDGNGPRPGDIERSITPRTRVVCITWVHSFTGYAVDLNELGKVCRQSGVTFVVNCSQALGTRQLNVAEVPVDALISVGFKWLCGPYGTGFCWITPELKSSLDYNQRYWLATLGQKELESAELDVTRELSSNYDVFGTANFFNFKPLTASVAYLLDQGIAEIAKYNDVLVDRLIAGLGPEEFVLHSPREGPNRSTLVFVSHRQPELNERIHQALVQRGIHTAFRAGKLRFSPHLYNTPEDIDRAVEALHSLSMKS